MLIDGHVHLENGPLTKEYCLTLIEAAKQKGINKLQILDHAHRFIEYLPMYEKYKITESQVEWIDSCCFDSLLDYYKMIEEVRKESLENIEVTFGLEVCYQHDDEDIISDLLKKYPFDFFIGSVHAVNHIAYDSHWSKKDLWDKYDADYIYIKYYEEMEYLVKSRLFNQIGHPDTIKMFNIYPSFDQTEIQTHFAKICAEYEILVENNTGCYYRYNHKDMGLDSKFLKILKDNNCKFITCSDAHYAKDIGSYILEATNDIIKA